MQVGFRNCDRLRGVGPIRVSGFRFLGLGFRGLGFGVDPLSMPPITQRRDMWLMGSASTQATSAPSTSATTESKGFTLSLLAQRVHVGIWYKGTGFRV